MTDKKRQSAHDYRLERLPFDGNTRAKDAARFLGIGLSSFHLAVKQGRIRKPVKLSARTSVWSCEYIRDLAANGLPEAGTEHASTTVAGENNHEK